MATILLIEDDELSRFTVRRVLHAAGHEVVDATSGKEGLGLVKSQSFDLIVTDIVIQSNTV